MNAPLIHKNVRDAQSIIAMTHQELLTWASSHSTSIKSYEDALNFAIGYISQCLRNIERAI